MITSYPGDPDSPGVDNSRASAEALSRSVCLLLPLIYMYAYWKLMRYINVLRKKNLKNSCTNYFFFTHVWF